MVIEEGEKQRLDMASVVIGIGPDDDLAVMDVLNLELIAIAGPDRINQRGDFLISEKDLLILDFSCVLRLSAEREDGLSLRIAAFLCRTACRIPLDDKEFVLPLVLA